MTAPGRRATDSIWNDKPWAGQPEPATYWFGCATPGCGARVAPTADPDSSDRVHCITCTLAGAALYVAPNDQLEPVIWEPGIVPGKPLPVLVRSEAPTLFDLLAPHLPSQATPVRFTP